MVFRSALFLLIVVIQNISTDEYRGEDFPTKYLDVDNVTPTMADINYYLDSLKRSVMYLIERPNSTDINQALGVFYSKAILRRTIQDFGHTFKNEQLNSVRILIKMLDYVSSHYIYKTVEFGWPDIEYRISRLMVDDSVQIHTIGNFTRNRLKKWIFHDDNINGFIQDMDKGILPKEKYAELVESRRTYFIRIPDSDLCLSRVAYNHEPIDFNQFRPCKPDSLCRKAIRSSPSVAYTLSHRLLNQLMYNHLRRCYMESKDSDEELMEMLCANMYREAVYLARRGYFARDLFLEHIALCGLLGYEEFFRHQWFTKAASWIDEDGCVQEYLNFEINRTAIMLERAANDRRRTKKLRRLRAEIINNECHDHPMALMLIVLAHGIRHAIHYVTKAIVLG